MSIQLSEDQREFLRNIKDHIPKTFEDENLIGSAVLEATKLGFSPKAISVLLADRGIHLPANQIGKILKAKKSKTRGRPPGSGVKRVKTSSVDSDNASLTPDAKAPSKDASASAVVKRTDRRM